MESINLINELQEDEKIINKYNEYLNELSLEELEKECSDLFNAYINLYSQICSIKNNFYTFHIPSLLFYLDNEEVYFPVLLRNNIFNMQESILDSLKPANKVKCTLKLNYDKNYLVNFCIRYYKMIINCNVKIDTIKTYVLPYIYSVLNVVFNEKHENCFFHAEKLFGKYKDEEKYKDLIFNIVEEIMTYI